MSEINKSVCMFENIRRYGLAIIDDKITTGELKCLFDELVGYRRFFEEYVGEQSIEFKLTNAMLVLSRVLKQTGDDSSIKHWINKNPLYSEWYSRISKLLDQPEWKYHYGRRELTKDKLRALN